MVACGHDDHRPDRRSQPRRFTSPPRAGRLDPNLIQGLVYTVTAAGALLWLLVVLAVRARCRSAPLLAGVVTTVTAALALLLSGASEYGTQILPPL